MPNFTFIDLFAGIGGFRLALSQLGGKCLFSSEINEKARSVYFNNFKDLPAGDISKIPLSDIPEHDILCAGFPCQAFSISGKQLGFEDTRGTLFYEIVRIAKAKKPRVLILENVKNLLRHDGGETFSVMTSLLKELGYNVSSKVLNAKDFGLAQSRDRLIIIASLGNSMFSFDSVLKQPPLSLESVIDTDTPQNFLNKNDYTIIPTELITKKHQTGLMFCGFKNGRVRVNGAENSSKYSSRSHKQQNRIYHYKGTHPTLTSSETSGRYWIYDGQAVRKTSIAECFRLQGFPDNFIKTEKPSDNYKQIGNSVPVPMIKAVAAEVLRQFFSKKSKNN